MGAEHHVERTGCDALEYGRALRRRRRTGEQRPRNTCGIEERAALDGILTRKDTGGRHNARLITRIRRAGKRYAGHGGLARAHIAEEQAVHHMLGIAHIAENISDRGLLLIRERERQRLTHGTHVSAHTVRKRRDVEKVAVVSKAQRELQAHEFVVSQATASELHLAHQSREMNGTQGPRKAHELPAGAQCGGHRIAEHTDLLQRNRRYATHPGLGYAVCHPVNRLDSRTRSSTIELLEVR